MKKIPGSIVVIFVMTALAMIALIVVSSTPHKITCGIMHVEVTTVFLPVHLTCTGTNQVTAIVGTSAHVLDSGGQFINEAVYQNGEDVTWKFLNIDCGWSYLGRDCKYPFYRISFWIDP